MIGRYWTLLGVVALAALLLVACGGTSTATPASSSAPSSSASIPAPAVGAAPSTASASGSTAAAQSSAAASASGSAASAQPSAAATGAPNASAAASGGPAAASAATPTPTTAEKYKIVPDKSNATYKVGEIFINQGNQYNLAEGTTGEVNGELAINRTNPTLSTIGPIKVDINKLASDSDRRDDQIRNGWLETKKYPIATFTTKRLEGLPTTPYIDGTELKFKIIGDMTIHNTTKELTFEATAKIVNGVLTGTAVAKFNMTDFGFDPPSIFGILKAENAVELVMTIEATKQP